MKYELCIHKQSLTFELYVLYYTSFSSPTKKGFLTPRVAHTIQVHYVGLTPGAYPLQTVNNQLQTISCTIHWVGGSGLAYTAKAWRHFPTPHRV